MKTCPRCAEQVMAAAAVCRYCGHKFESEDRRRGLLLLGGALGGGAILLIVALGAWTSLTGGAPSPSASATTGPVANISPSPEASPTLVANATPTLGPTPTLDPTPTLGPTSTPGPTPTALPTPLSFTAADTLCKAADECQLEDMAAFGPNVAVAWTQMSLASAWVATSGDSGTSWSTVGLGVHPGTHGFDISLTSDIGRGAIAAIWTESQAGQLSPSAIWTSWFFPPGPWQAGHQISDDADGSLAQGASIALGGPYVFYTYQQQSSFGSPSIARLRTEDTAGNMSSPIVLGPLGGNLGVRLAASQHAVLAVWSGADGEIWVRRGTFGTGVAPPITWSTWDLGPGVYADVALSGNNGLIAWNNNDSVFASYSADAGATWSTPAKVLKGGGANMYDLGDVAMSGQDAAITAEAQDSPFTGYGVRLVSADGGATWTKSTSFGYQYDDRQVAYVDSPTGGQSLAEAWNDTKNYPNAVKFHRMQ